VEGRVAAPGRRDRAGDPGLLLPAGHQQVEQDRASAVLLHHHQLARQTAHRAYDDRQPDRLHDHPQRPEGLSRRDEGSYPAKVTVSHAELEAVALQGDGFHPEWNYTIEPRVITWRRLTLDVEGAAGASAWGAVATGCFARLLSREVDWTPRSEVLDETSSATVSGADAEGQRIRGGWLGRRPFCRRVRSACDRSGAKGRSSQASLVPKHGARAGSACALEGHGNGPIPSRRMGGHNGRCRHRSSDEDHEDPQG